MDPDFQPLSFDARTASRLGENYFFDFLAQNHQKYLYKEDASSYELTSEESHNERAINSSKRHE